MPLFCLNIPLYHWSPSTNEEIHTDNYPDCYNNNWIYVNTDITTLTPIKNSSNLCRTANGHIHGGAASNGHIVRPTLYLTHNTKVTDGDGTYENPYQININ